MDQQADPDAWLTPESYRKHSTETKAEIEKEHRQEVDDLRKRLAENPRQPQLHLRLAETLTALLQHDAAIETLQDACAACPSVNLSAALVQALAECNRTEEAISAAQAALQVFPKNFLLTLKEALLLPITYRLDRANRTLSRAVCGGVEAIGRGLENRHSKTAAGRSRGRRAPRQFLSASSGSGRQGATGTVCDDGTENHAGDVSGMDAYAGGSVAS